MHSDRVISRSTPCKDGENGGWLTVYDLVPMALRSYSIDEPPETNSARGWAFLFLAIFCLISALAIIVLLFVPWFSSLLAPQPVRPEEMIAGTLATSILAINMVMFLLPFVGLLLFAFWVWMLVSALKNEPAGEDRIVWILVIILTGPIGALIYAFMRYRSRPRQLSP